MKRRPSSHKRHQARQKQKTDADSRKQKLPRNVAPIELTIDHIGGRGDGVGSASFTYKYETKDWRIFVPLCLPGERVRVQPHSLSSNGIHADLIELLEASSDRVDPACPVAHSCGGCQFQHLTDSAYDALKEESVKAPLQRAGLEPHNWRQMAKSGQHSRRRVRFSFRRTSTDLIIGLHERNSEKIIEPTGCITIAQIILSVRTFLKSSLKPLLPIGLSGALHLTELDSGVDVLIELDNMPDPNSLAQVSHCAADNTDIIRLSLRVQNELDTPLYAPEMPVLSWPNATITPPAGSFLQASKSGEATLQAGVAEIAADAKQVVDLFCGSGTLSLPLLAQDCQVYGSDNAGPALNAFKQAADRAGRGGQLKIDARNLNDSPVTKEQLSDADLIILDPPRSGARTQIKEIAHSGCPRIAYISCNPHSFAKDAVELLQAGYQFDWCQPVDQFYYSSHVELISLFTLPQNAS